MSSRRARIRIIRALSQSRHAPRKRGIQYAAAARFITDAGDYWIIRWSLSSGGALRRPGGG
jgi:hypothetical protein